MTGTAVCAACADTLSHLQLQEEQDVLTLGMAQQRHSHQLQLREVLVTNQRLREHLENVESELPAEHTAGSHGAAEPGILVSRRFVLSPLLLACAQPDKLGMQAKRAKEVPLEAVSQQDLTFRLHELRTQLASEATSNRREIDTARAETSDLVRRLQVPQLGCMICSHAVTADNRLLLPAA